MLILLIRYHCNMCTLLKIQSRVFVLFEIDILQSRQINILQSQEKRYVYTMTGNGHIELFKVTSYNFHPQEQGFNSYTKLQASVSYTSLPKYTTFL